MKVTGNEKQIEDDVMRIITKNIYKYYAHRERLKAAKAEKKMDENFRSSDGRVFLVRCPKCHKENYSMAVSSGQCSWCGYDANKDEDYKKSLKEEK